jgi:hypothetical protein
LPVSARGPGHTKGLPSTRNLKVTETRIRNSSTENENDGSRSSVSASGGVIGSGASCGTNWKNSR